LCGDLLVHLQELYPVPVGVFHHGDTDPGLNFQRRDRHIIAGVLAGADNLVEIAHRHGPVTITSAACQAATGCLGRGFSSCWIILIMLVPHISRQVVEPGR